MTRELFFRRIADAEFAESARWYEDQREGLGFEFIDHVQQTLDRIAEDPLRYPIILRDIREAVLSKFPFAIFYRIKQDRVVIISIFHCSRDPSAWQSRD